MLEQATREIKAEAKRAHRAVYMRAWNAANPERRQAANKKYRDANFEKLRQYSVAHREYFRVHAAKWKAEHPETVRATYKAWCSANAPKKAVTRNRYRTRLTANFVEDVAVSVLANREKNKCGICGLVVSAKERSIDHILPISKGGKHSYANTRLVHLRCNIVRGNRGAAQLRILG